MQIWLQIPGFRHSLISAREEENAEAFTKTKQLLTTMVIAWNGILGKKIPPNPLIAPLKNRPRPVFNHLSEQCRVARTPTGFMIKELQPRRAVTFVADHQVAAQVWASTVVKKALVYIWNEKPGQKKRKNYTMVNILQAMCEEWWKERQVLGMLNKHCPFITTMPCRIRNVKSTKAA